MGKSRPWFWFYHLLPLLVFAALTALWTRPLASPLSAAIIGEHAGDNLTFVWSFWWARFAATDPAASLFWTHHLFAPLGSNLVLHTLVPAVTLWAAVVPEDIVTLYNLSLVVTVFLNAACTYALAWTLTGDRLAATCAAVAFAGAPHLLVRLLGHLNVLSAWALPLLLLAFVRLERKPSTVAAASTGAALALLAYLDYYYTIFGAVLLIVYVLSGRWSIHLTTRPLTPMRRRALTMLLGFLAILLLAILAIWMSGGTEWTLAGRTVSIRSTFNARAAAWLIAITLLIVWTAPRIRLERVVVSLVALPWLTAAATSAVALLLPLVVSAVSVVAAGDYVTQRFSWRSAPGGIDLAALALGNPLHVLTGEWTTRAYRALRINPVEGAAWLGAAQVLLLATAFGRVRRQPEGRRLLLVAAVFFVWALGPYLTIAGHNTALLLPQSFFKFVPILSNARIPARALTVVLLMLALCGAMALASIGSHKRRGVALTALAIAILDTWPRANPIVIIERPPLYAALRAQPPGPVLEVPLGTRDSFGSRGFLDHQVLFYQTIHEHPLVGGMVTRLSPRTARAYDDDPILGALLDLSERKQAKAPTPCLDTLACAVRYVVINEGLTSDPLRAFVNRTFDLEMLEQDGGRTLYRVTALTSCDCPAPHP